MLKSLDLALISDNDVFLGQRSPDAGMPVTSVGSSSDKMVVEVDGLPTTCALKQQTTACLKLMSDRPSSRTYTAVALSPAVTVATTVTYTGVQGNQVFNGLPRSGPGEGIQLPSGTFSDFWGLF